VDHLGPDNAFWDDGEWISWDSIPDWDEGNTSHLARLEHQAALAIAFPKADLTLVPYFQNLLALAEGYYRDTGNHLQVYGDIGELFGAITYGISLHRQYAQGSDGKLGRDFVEIKTITPFKKVDKVTVNLDRHFSKLLIVKIDDSFQVSGRMLARKDLPATRSRQLEVHWNGLRPDLR